MARRLHIAVRMDASTIFDAAITRRVLLTIAALVVAVVLSWIIRRLGAALSDSRTQGGRRAEFWGAQVGQLAALAVVVATVIWVWFGGLQGAGAVGGLVAAGLAVAMQRVVTSFAAYLIILRGKIFSVGDRITIGGVRGDVVGLGFMQTTVMEMGQEPAEQGDDPSMWVHGRQFTGRIVQITNDKIFDSPVYNFTREFPFVWEEIRIPVDVDDKVERAEQILLAAARNHTSEIQALARQHTPRFVTKYLLNEEPSVEPRVFLRITDNWVELALRFVALPHEVRSLKDAMNREILREMLAAGIGIASTTFAVTDLPPVKVRVTDS